jgi:hypothetical protein
MYNGKHVKHSVKHYRIDEKREKLEYEKLELQILCHKTSDPERQGAIKRMIARIDLQLSPPLTPSY